MHILRINARIIKIELLPDFYDMIMVLLRGVVSHQRSPSSSFQVNVDGPIFVPTRSTKVQTRPNTTISIRGHATNRTDTQGALLIAIVGFAITYFTTVFLIISMHGERMENPYFSAATLCRRKRRINRANPREKRQPIYIFNGFAVTIILSSCLLWAFGTLHAPSQLLWTLFRNSFYTIARWTLEHPGTVVVTISNILFGLDAFDALFSHVIGLQRYGTHSPHPKCTLDNITMGFMWLPIWTFGALVVLLNRLGVLALSKMWNFIRRRSSPHVLEDTKASKTVERQEAQAGRSWLPIELSGGVPAQLDCNNIVGMKDVTEGGFGQIYLATDAGSGRMLAVKRVSKRFLGEDGEPFLLDEIRAHHRMNSNPRFPPLLGCFLDERDYILVMPYFPRGNLSNLIKDSGGYLNRSLARFYCAELFLAIRGLHKARIIHGDLKPENILLDENRHLVVTDFGLATVFGKNQEQRREYPLWRDAKKRGGSQFPLLWPNGNPHTVCRADGTEVYAAKEVFLKQHFSYGVDYWSMGVIYHEMVTGQLPYDMTWKNGVRHIHHPLTVNLNQQARHLQLLDSLSLRFLTQVLSPVPESRSSVREMKRDRMWYKINWKAMGRKEIKVPNT